MNLKKILSLVKLPHKRALIELKSLMESYAKLLYFFTIIESGIINTLNHTKKLDEIKSSLNIKRLDLLESLLSLGVAIGELKRVNNKYKIKGSLTKAILSDNMGGSFSHQIREIVLYQGDVCKFLPDRLKGLNSENYLEKFGKLFAQSSRIGEPFIKYFIEEVVNPKYPIKILEVGCGAGEYLKYYTKINNKNSGIAIDVDKNVVKLARESLKRNRINSNFKVLCEDIRKPSGLINGPFDLITSYQNVYYFTDKERIDFFKSVKERLRSEGKFALVSIFKSKKKMSLYWEILFTSTEGLYSLPDIKKTISELKDVGFTHIQKINLIPGESFRGIIAN